MTGDCDHCDKQIRGKAVHANLKDDGLVKFCSHECRKKYMGRWEEDDDSRNPWAKMF